MLNYIRAECYKVLRRPYTYIALAVLLGLEGLLVAGHAFHNAHSLATPFGGAIVLIVELGAIGFCICLLTGDMVFAAQYKNSTLKNEVSFGLSRERIYLGKLIAQTLLSAAYLVIMMAFFIGLCAIVLPLEPIPVEGFYSTTAVDALTIVGWFLAAGLPLWIGAQAAMCMCLFWTNGEMASSFLYVGLVFVLENVIDVAGLLIGGEPGALLLKIRQYFPGFVLGQAKAAVGDWGFMSQAWIVGAFWVAAFTAIGLWGFKRKEIK